MRFIFVTVNFNGARHTGDYLNSIRQLELMPEDAVQTLIVDNDSDAADVAELQSYIEASKNEVFISAGRNMGYFAGLNVGLDRIEKDHETVLIVGNNDVQFSPDFIQVLKYLHIEKDIYVLAPDITTLDGRKQNPHVIERVGRFDKFKADLYFVNYYLTRQVSVVKAVIKSLRKIRNCQIEERVYPEMRIKRGIGACYVLLPAFFNNNERLDDRVFLWGEEALLSHQIESTGGATLYTPSLKVKHLESASVKTLVGRDKYNILKTSYKIYRSYL